MPELLDRHFVSAIIPQVPADAQLPDSTATADLAPQGVDSGEAVRRGTLDAEARRDSARQPCKSTADLRDARVDAGGRKARSATHRVEPIWGLGAGAIAI